MQRISNRTVLPEIVSNRTGPTRDSASISKQLQSQFMDTNRSKRKKQSTLRADRPSVKMTGESSVNMSEFKKKIVKNDYHQLIANTTFEKNLRKSAIEGAIKVKRIPGLLVSTDTNPLDTLATPNVRIDESTDERQGSVIRGEKTVEDMPVAISIEQASIASGEGAMTAKLVRGSEETLVEDA